MTTNSSATPSPLPREFYNRDCVLVASKLLGKSLYRETPDGLAGGRIVEVEAYLGFDDPASHSYRGLKPRNRSMFGPPGHAYVYSIHARWCMNVVVRPEGTPHAVLIRAIEPLVGLDLMRRRRGREKLLELARGPARLCEALSIDRRQDGWDLSQGEGLWIEDEHQVESAKDQIVFSPRIGVTSAKEEKLRLFLRDCRWVSGKRTFSS